MRLPQTPAADMARGGSDLVASSVGREVQSIGPGNLNSHPPTHQSCPEGVVAMGPGPVDPHRETLDRFIRTPHDTGAWDSGSYWAKKWAVRDEIDSDPITDLYDHPCGDACPGDCDDT